MIDWTLEPEAKDYLRDNICHLEQKKHFSAIHAVFAFLLTQKFKSGIRTHFAPKFAPKYYAKLCEILRKNNREQERLIETTIAIQSLKTKGFRVMSLI